MLRRLALMDADFALTAKARERLEAFNSQTDFARLHDDLAKLLAALSPSNQQDIWLMLERISLNEDLP